MKLLLALAIGALAGWIARGRRHVGMQGQAERLARALRQSEAELRAATEASKNQS